jgi:hypothetical protein
MLNEIQVELRVKRSSGAQLLAALFARFFCFWEALNGILV